MRAIGMCDLRDFRLPCLNRPMNRGERLYPCLYRNRDFRLPGSPLSHQRLLAAKCIGQNAWRPADRMKTIIEVIGRHSGPIGTAFGLLLNR